MSDFRVDDVTVMKVVCVWYVQPLIVLVLLLDTYRIRSFWYYISNFLCCSLNSSYELFRKRAGKADRKNDGLH